MAFDLLKMFTPSKSDNQSGEEYNRLYNIGGLPDSLYTQLKALGARVPEQVAAQKANTAARIDTARTEGTQSINENIRAERGFGNTSLQDRLNSELADKLLRAQSEADLNSDIWGTNTEADLLSKAYDSLPKATTEQPSWQSNLMNGVGNIFGNWLGTGSNSSDLLSGIMKMFGGGGNGVGSSQGTITTLNAPSSSGVGISSGTSGGGNWAQSLYDMFKGWGT